MFRHLPLTFPRDTYKGAFVALACANGINLRYEVRKVMTGEWQLSIDADNRMERSWQFGSERKAKAFARDDFRRRQLLTAVAA